MKKCPFCAEEIQDLAIKCRYCGEWLNVKERDRIKAGFTENITSENVIINEKKEENQKEDSKHKYRYGELTEPSELKYGSEKNNSYNNQLDKNEIKKGILEIEGKEKIFEKESQKLDLGHNEPNEEELRKFYREMPLSRLKTIEQSFHEDDYTHLAQKIMKEIFIERRDEKETDENSEIEISENLIEKEQAVKIMP